MAEITLDTLAQRMTRQLPSGLFLCAGSDTPNVMTIGWGAIGYFWRKHVCIVPVRPQRHTYPLLQREGRFTVSIPAAGAFKEALLLAGTLSGRDGDKFARIGLKTAPGRAVNAPVVRGCAGYLECVVRAAFSMRAEELDAEIVGSAYPAGDFHTAFYGEIVSFYGGEAP